MVDISERRLSHVFDALSDPGRRWIVRRLAQNPCTPSDLTKPLHMSLQGVTKHVAVLERAGIVKREKRGRQRILSLEGASLHAAGAWIDHYRAFWETKLDALASHVTGPAHSTHPARVSHAPARKDHHP
ncbi:MAG: helix-turn-helix transcriptional regulator [Phycisphaeraceae bacterium]|nr:helix-turn-helix transcriptional regulator [Phycisphaeraceae bacterium]